MARVAFKTAFGSFPRQGNRALPVVISFNANAVFSDDLSPEMFSSQIESVQAVYVDNSQNLNPITFVFCGAQVLVVKPGKQGIFPVIAQGILTYTATSVVAPGLNVNLLFLNNTPNFAEWGGA